MMLYKPLLLLVLALTAIEAADQNDCIPRSYGRSSIVCVCNATYCDTILPPTQLPQNQYVSYTSTQAGLRFKKEQGEFGRPSDDSSDYTLITIDAQTQYQTIFGWGGSFTDATGININSLSSAASEKLYRSYFTEDGLEYNLCRVPIGGTDFSTRGYSYNDGEEDSELANFKLASEDYQYKLPVIKKAQNLTNGKLELFASAWTAPKWMKENGKYTGPDFLKKSMYQAWADYFLKFLQAYKNEGVTFWGLTTGNEPSTGLMPSKINAVGWMPKQMREWIGTNLGPTIRNSEFSSIKLIAIDDQAYYYDWFIDKLFEDKTVEDYIDGFGLHWYWNRFLGHQRYTRTHNKYPNKFILATEACEGYLFFTQKVIMGSWERGEAYAKDILRDLNNWVTGWVDWNMALDLTGGPTYIDNRVDSPIIVNKTADEFYKQPMYYALGHFTKFIPKGSVRISATQSSTSVEFVAFRRPDNATAVVIINRSREDVPIKLQNTAELELTKIIPRKSFVTILYW